MNKGDKKNQTGTSEKTIGRRKLLKSVVAGGGAATVAKMLPDQWARPVVDSVMLPSHAQTSNSPFGPFVAQGVNAGNEPATQMAEQGFSEELMEFFAPVAQAGVDIVTGADFSLTSNETGDSYFCADDASSDPEWISIQIQNESFTSGKCMLGGTVEVLSGNFVQNTGWVVALAGGPGFNVTTDVVLTEGGPGCDQSFGDEGGFCMGG